MAFQSKMQSLTPRRQKHQQQVKLLSGGYTAPQSFPDGNITVYPWDSSIDDWMEERLKQGNRHRLLYDLVGQVSNLNGCSIEKFVVGDISTVLLVSRAIRFDNLIEYEAICANCGNPELSRIKVPDELGRVAEKTSGFPGYDIITLPDCQDALKIRPLLVKDEIYISERDDTSKQLASDRVMHILLPIMTVNDGKPDTWEELNTYYQALSPVDAAFLEDQENTLYPHLDTEIPHKCDICRRQFKFNLDFNADFFRSRVKSGSGTSMAKNVRPGME